MKRRSNLESNVEQLSEEGIQLQLKEKERKTKALMFKLFQRFIQDMQINLHNKDVLKNLFYTHYYCISQKMPI